MSEFVNYMFKVIIKEDVLDIVYGEDVVFEIKLVVYNNFWFVLLNLSQIWELVNEENVFFFRRVIFFLIVINIMYGVWGYCVFFEVVVEQFVIDIGVDFIVLDIEDVLDLGEYWLNGLESWGCVLEGKRDKLLLFVYILFDVLDQRIFRYGIGSVMFEC